MNKTLKTNLRNLNWSLLVTLILISLIPTVYTTVRIFFLGNIPSDWGFNIASQLAWVNVMYEVIQEAMILPLFYLIGKSLTDKKQIENKLKSGLITAFLIYFVSSMLLFIFARFFNLLCFFDVVVHLCKKSINYDVTKRSNTRRICNIHQN